MVANFFAEFAVKPFCTNPQGQTTNIKIDQSQPAGAFEQEVIKAISSWQYTHPYSEIEQIQVQVDFRKPDSQPLQPVQQGVEGILIVVGLFGKRKSHHHRAASHPAPPSQTAVG